MNNENKKGRPNQPHDDTFRQRFLSLIGANASQAEIAEKIGTSRQNVGNWLNKGSTKPDIYTLTRIAKAYNVSADYLLGLSDCRSSDTTIKDMCEYTGLSEESIHSLHDVLEKEEYLCPILDRMIKAGCLEVIK